MTSAQMTALKGGTEIMCMRFFPGFTVGAKYKITRGRAGRYIADDKGIRRFIMNENSIAYHFERIL